MKGLRSMSRVWRTLLLTSVLIGAATGPALAQIAPMGTVTPPTARPKPAQVQAKKPQPPVSRTAPDALAPSNPDFKADQPVATQMAPAPAPLPPAVWDAANAEDLLRYIEGVEKEGLE